MHIKAGKIFSGDLSSEHPWMHTPQHSNPPPPWKKKEKISHIKGNPTDFDNDNL